MFPTFFLLLSLPFYLSLSPQRSLFTFLVLAVFLSPPTRLILFHFALVSEYTCGLEVIKVSYLWRRLPFKNRKREKKKKEEEDKEDGGEEKEDDKGEVEEEEEEEE
jgi:hypothetical protein